MMMEQDKKKYALLAILLLGIIVLDLASIEGNVISAGVGLLLGITASGGLLLCCMKLNIMLFDEGSMLAQLNLWVQGGSVQPEQSAATFCIERESTAIRSQDSYLMKSA